jgi:glycosyltransferase involved in cell wall biosynthesis
MRVSDDRQTMRLAYCSPLPPLRSGVADYSSELLPELAGQFEIHLFVERGRRPDARLAKRFPVFSISSLTSRSPYNAVLYHLGNHAGMYGKIYLKALEVPGILVLHEYMLHHMVLEVALAAGGDSAYLEVMRHCYGRSGRLYGNRVLLGDDQNIWAFPLFEKVLDASLGAIVHNDSARRRILASRPRAQVFKVPHHLSLEGLPDRAPASDSDLREMLGLPSRALVFGSFGFVAEAKRIEVVLRAFARLRRRLPEAIYLIVGDVSPHPSLIKLLRGDLGAGVVATGRVDLERFLRYMRASDVAINLRHPTGGETSGTLIRLLGMGKPVIVSNTGSFAEIPDDCCAKISVDEVEEETLLACMSTLAEDPDLRQWIGENAREYALKHHGLKDSARGYARAVSRIVASRSRPGRPASPMEPRPPEDVQSALAAEVGASLFDLGIENDDEEALSAIARILIDLELA